MPSQPQESVNAEALLNNGEMKGLCTVRGRGIHADPICLSQFQVAVIPTGVPCFL